MKRKPPQDSEKHQVVDSRPDSRGIRVMPMRATPPPAMSCLMPWLFTNAIDVLQTLVIALGGGLCVWGGINLLEGYGQDNPASNAHVR